MDTRSRCATDDSARPHLRTNHALVYALAARRDEQTAAALMLHDSARSPKKLRADLARLADEFEAAGCPSMAAHARRIAREVRPDLRTTAAAA